MPAEETATKIPTSAEKKAEALLAAACEALLRRLIRPKCKWTRTRAAFGLRVIVRDTKGVPTRSAGQSYYKACRN